jgi:hypothetical protein
VEARSLGVTITVADLRMLAARRKATDKVLSREPAPSGALRVFLPINLRNPMNGSWGSWQKHARLMRQMRDQATTALYLATTPAQRTEISVYARAPKRITFRAYVGHLWDENEGIPPACKPYRDSLVTMGVIHDDGPRSGHDHRGTETPGGSRDVSPTPKPDTPIDGRTYARIYARGLALERAIQACGPGALPSQIIEYADRFYPFLAQEILKDGE